jgi:hypothetical protein
MDGIHRVEDNILPVARIMLDITTLWTDELQRRVFMGNHALQFLDLYVNRAGTAALMLTTLRAHDEECKAVAMKYSRMAANLARDYQAWNSTPSLEFNRYRHMAHFLTPSIWTKLLALFVRLYNSQRCSSPDCARTFADGIAAFGSCSGCNRVAYCSRSCQKAAWKHAAAPHRAICSSIRRACRNYDIPRRRLEPLDYEQQSEPPESFKESIARRILEHFAAQAEYEINVSRACCRRVHGAI